MLDNESNDTTPASTPTADETPKKAPRRRATKAASAPVATEGTPAQTAVTSATPDATSEATSDAGQPAADGTEAPKKAPAKRAPAKKAAPRKKAAPKGAANADVEGADTDSGTSAGTGTGTSPAGEAPSGEAPSGEVQAGEAQSGRGDSGRPARTRNRVPAVPNLTEPDQSGADAAADADADVDAPRRRTRSPAVIVTFQAPEPAPAQAEGTPRPRRRAGTAGVVSPTELLAANEAATEAATDAAAEEGDEESEDAESTAARRRRRGRRGRGGRPAHGEDTTSEDEESTESAEGAEGAEGEDEGDENDDEEGGSASATRRRRRRRRSGGGGGGLADGEDDVPTVTHVREPGSRESGNREPRQRAPRNRDGGNAADEDGVRGISGSTRMAAKRVRRQEGRDTGRKRPPILSEAEFLARREAVDRQMVVRQKGDRTQIAVLEDGILVEHYVTKASATSYAGNVYLGRVQNVLPSMEAAFVDIGKGRNAVLYAGEVNWDGVGGGSRKIEQALKSGQEVLVQVSKDPIGHKGARLTSQISLPGRYLVYVPESTMTGISRKLPENERTRLKNILRNVVPEGAGVIIRTAAEGVSEEEIAKDVRRLQAQWEVISGKVAAGGGPKVLHAEPDLVIKVVRDIFNEDFTSLVVQGESEWETIREYVEFVAPDLAPRLSKFAGNGDVFAEHRIDEQLLKALDRKVYLPSGGSLVIDRTEAMIVVDVNTGKYVGKGGNLEETVTRNNLEAAEEIARQLRLRDLGGIIVVDFIDMVLESNRDLVVRRLVECLGRDRTKHQVAEVTSLGLVQMTRKRVGQGLLESFSETCEHCNGRGVKIHLDPIEPKPERDRDRAPRVGPKAPVPAGAAAPAEEATPGAGGSRNRRRRGGRGQGTSTVDPSAELNEILTSTSEADAVVPSPAHVVELQDEVPVEDAVEQAVEVVLEPDAVPVLADEPFAEELVSILAAETPAAPAEGAGETAVPAKKRRRAVSRPAGAPTD